MNLKKIILPFFASALLLTASSAPLLVNAVVDTNCQFDQGSTEFCNPLPDNNVEDLVFRLLKFFLGIIAAVAVVVIVIAGFRMVISAGNAKQIEGARSAITWALVGIVVAVLAYSFVAILQNVLQGSANSQ